MLRSNTRKCRTVCKLFRAKVLICYERGSPRLTKCPRLINRVSYVTILKYLTLSVSFPIEWHCKRDLKRANWKKISLDFLEFGTSKYHLNFTWEGKKRGNSFLTKTNNFDLQVGGILEQYFQTIVILRYSLWGNRKKNFLSCSNFESRRTSLHTNFINLQFSYFWKKKYRYSISHNFIPPNLAFDDSTKLFALNLESLHHGWTAINYVQTTPPRRTTAIHKIITKIEPNSWKKASLEMTLPKRRPCLTLASFQPPYSISNRETRFLYNCSVVYEPIQENHLIDMCIRILHAYPHAAFSIPIFKPLRFYSQLHLIPTRRDNKRKSI